MSWFKQKTILVPFDFSEDSLDAVRAALLMSEKREDVHVLHVLAQFPPTDPVYIWDENADAKRMEHVRENMGEEMKKLGVENVHLNVAVGNPATVITELADEINADLIVIPSHGRTGVKRLMLGSVAERVVRLAHCPVFVLKKSK